MFSARKAGIALAGTLAAGLWIGSAAHAQTFTEVENNNNFATAQVLSPTTGTILVNGSRVDDSSADFFKFFASAGDMVTLTVDTPGGPTFDNDPVLGLYNPSGMQVAVDDDAGPGFDSLISNFSIGSTGFWAAAVSGFADFNFNGGGSTNFPYTLTIRGATPSAAPVPEPGAMATAGIMGGMTVLGMLRYRRRKA